MMEMSISADIPFSEHTCVYGKLLHFHSHILPLFLYNIVILHLKLKTGTQLIY